MKPIKMKSLLEDMSDDGMSEDAGDDADNMGLVHRGWGRYYDPNTGQLVAKSVNGQLVKVNATDDDNTDPDHEDAFSRLQANPDAPSKMSQAAAAFQSSHFKDDPAQAAKAQKLQKMASLLTQMKDNGADFDALSPETKAQLAAVLKAKQQGTMPSLTSMIPNDDPDATPSPDDEYHKNPGLYGADQ